MLRRLRGGITKDEFVGFIYPISVHQIKRIFSSKEIYFLKCTGGRILKYIEKDMKLFFYISNSGHRIAGEGKIFDIKSMKYNEIVKKYLNKLCFTRDELESYMMGRKNELIMLYGLNEIKEYTKPIYLHKRTTMAGEYMRKEWYDAILKDFENIK